MELPSLILILQIVVISSWTIPNEYLEQRLNVLKNEEERYLGSQLSLDENEIGADGILMQHKVDELNYGFDHPDKFLSANYFWNVKDAIHQSKVFEFIKNMPKGGALHLHEISITSIDWVIDELTYRDHLYACISQDDVDFKWSDEIPKTECESVWKTTTQLRDEAGDDKINSIFRKALDISRKEDYGDVDSVWRAFQGALGKIVQLTSLERAYDDYIYRGISEFYGDQVSYMEIRTVLPSEICVDLKCSRKLSQVELVELNKRIVDRFMSNHSDFCGVKFIYAPIRHVSQNEFNHHYAPLLKELREKFPDFIAGFDLVGQEDKGYSLLNFLDGLLGMRKTEPDLKFFFHAGETDWQGSTTDLNLMDAVLLNTSRIGHGYAITKHPKVYEMAVEKDIAIEICPISNQVLGLVKDLRNHPGATIIQEGSLPTVISSDDPATWGGKGLSYDFYVTMMALSSKSMGLKLLKELVLNSIKYSAMSQSERNLCDKIVTTKWADYMKIFNVKVVSLEL